MILQRHSESMYNYTKQSYIVCHLNFEPMLSVKSKLRLDTQNKKKNLEFGTSD